MTRRSIAISLVGTVAPLGIGFSFVRVSYIIDFQQTGCRQIQPVTLKKSGSIEMPTGLVLSTPNSVFVVQFAFR